MTFVHFDNEQITPTCTRFLCTFLTWFVDAFDENTWVFKFQNVDS